MLAGSSLAYSVPSGAAIWLNALRGLGYSLQLFETKILQESGLGVEGPIERTDATLAVAGVDPVDQFLIGELVGVTLAVVNVSTINLAMPQDAVLGWQAGWGEPLEVLLAPGVAAREVIESLTDTGLLVGAIAERDHAAWVGLANDGTDGPPIVGLVLVGVDSDSIEPPTRDFALIPDAILPEHL